MRAGSGVEQAREAIHAHLDHMVACAAFCMAVEVERSGLLLELREHLVGNLLMVLRETRLLLRENREALLRLLPLRKPGEHAKRSPPCMTMEKVKYLFSIIVAQLETSPTHCGHA